MSVLLAAAAITMLSLAFEALPSRTQALLVWSGCFLVSPQLVHVAYQAGFGKRARRVLLSAPERPDIMALRGLLELAVWADGSETMHLANRVLARALDAIRAEDAGAIELPDMRRLCLLLDAACAPDGSAVELSSSILRAITRTGAVGALDTVERFSRSSLVAVGSTELKDAVKECLGLLRERRLALAARSTLLRGAGRATDDLLRGAAGSETGPNESGDLLLPRDAPPS